MAASREIEFDDNGNVIERRQVISNTKTVLSVRTFKIADNVVNCLHDWLAYQKEQEAKRGIRYTDANCHVFCQREGEMRSYSGLRSMLRRFLVKAQLDGHDINLYTFRHTFATILLEERENPKIVSELMGHSKVLTTLSIYSHIISKSIYESTAQTLDRAFADLTAANNKTDMSEPTYPQIPLKI